jgi:hypothetical protein
MPGRSILDPIEWMMGESMAGMIEKVSMLDKKKMNDD